jgi:NACalpha-BTF3-like transcription factor
MAEQESSLKLLPAEAVRGPMLLPAEIPSMEAVTTEIVEQASSDTNVAASTQKAALGTGFYELGKYVDAKKVEADMTLGEEEEKASFPETKGTVPGATVKLDEIISRRLPYSVVDEIDWYEGVEDNDEDANLSEADFQLIVDRANAKYNKFVEMLLARTPNPLVFKEMTTADFLNSDDEEVYA